SVATFAQMTEMRSRKTTFNPYMNALTTLPSLPKSGLPYARTRGRRFLWVSGFVAAMRAPIVPSSASAAAIDALGAGVPETEIGGPVRGVSVEAFTRSGIQMRSATGKPNPSGITPTTVTVTVPSFAVLPTTLGSLENRDFHNV